MKLTLFIVSLSALILLPITLSYSHASASATSTCSTQISQQESKIANLDLEKKAVGYIFNNSADIKSLHQKYQVKWLSTNYNWNASSSTCTAVLNDIVATFELSNSTSPFVGEIHVTVDPQVSKVISVKTDTPATVIPPNCTDQACRAAHGIFY